MPRSCPTTLTASDMVVIRPDATTHLRSWTYALYAGCEPFLGQASQQQEQRSAGTVQSAAPPARAFNGRRGLWTLDAQENSHVV